MWLVEFIKSNYYLKNLLPLVVYILCFGIIYIISNHLLSNNTNNKSSKGVASLVSLILTTLLYVAFIKVMGFSRFDYILDGIKFINSYFVISLYGLFILLSNFSSVIISFTLVLSTLYEAILTTSIFDFKNIFIYICLSLNVAIKDKVLLICNCLVNKTIESYNNISISLQKLNCSFNC